MGAFDYVILGAALGGSLWQPVWFRRQGDRERRGFFSGSPFNSVRNFLSIFIESID